MVVKALVWAGAVVSTLTEKALIDLMVGVGIGTLPDVDITVVTAVVAVVVIDLEFVLIDALTGALRGVIIGIMPGVAVDIFTNVKVNILVASITVLEFFTSAPL